MYIKVNPNYDFTYILYCIIKQPEILLSRIKRCILLALLYNFKYMAKIVGLIAKNIKRLRELKQPFSKRNLCGCWFTARALQPY